MIETLRDMGGEPLPAGRPFNFECSPGLDCFGACCRDKRLPLMPYDALRLCRALDMPTTDFLGEYTELEADPRSGWPTLRIHLNRDGVCPFLSPSGCRVYEDRPTCCRIFPVVRAVKRDPKTGRSHQLYLRQKTTGCLGWDQPRALTPEQWVADQGLPLYHRYNDRLMDLVMHPARKGKLDLTPPQVHAFVAALFNLDIFLRLVGDPGFASQFGFASARVAAALLDREELMLLGQDWLTAQLFGG